MADVSTRELRVELEKAKKAAEDFLNVWDNLDDQITATGKSLKTALESIDLRDSKSIAELNELLKQTNELAEQQTKVTNEQRKAAKELLAIEKQQAQLEKAQTQSQQQKVKLTKEEEALKQQQIRTEIILAKEQERRAKIEEKERKQVQESTRAYVRKSKQLNELRKEYKDLVVAEGRVTKESRKLLRQIKALDEELKDVDASAGQFQRNVGNYPDTLGKALDSVKGLAAGLLGLGAAAESVTTALEANEEGSEDLQKVSAGLNAVWETAKNRAATAALGVFDFAVALKETATGERSFIGGIGALNKAVDDVTESFDGFTDEATENAKAAVDAEQQQIDLSKALRQLNKDLALLNGEYEKQSAIAGDSTQSFDTIEAAAEAAAQASVKRSAILQKIAQEELDIIKTQLEARSDDANNRELLNQKAEAEIKLIEAGNELRQEQLELDKIIRENNRDRFERELDFAIDAFDTIKTVNERIIANERLSIDARRALLDETSALTEKSFQEQIKLVEDYTGQKLNLDELVLESDEKVIRERLAAADLDDVTLGRILEIIRERKLAQQDLIESNQDLADSETELAELRRDIADQEVALASENEGKFEQLEADRTQNELENIEARLENVEKGSVEEARLIKERNDILLAEQQAAAEKQAELDDEQNEKTKENELKRQEIIKASIDSIDQIIQNSFDKRNEAIENELENTLSAQERIKAGIEAGNADAQASLAAEERREAELRAQQEENRKKAQRAEAAIALLRNLGENGGNLGQTLSNYSAILAAIQAAPTFYHGTDETSSNVIFDDKYGGVTGFVHAGEQVWSKQDRKDVGGRTRAEIKDIVNNESRNLITDPKLAFKIVDAQSESLILEVQGLRKSVDTLHKRMPVQMHNYDAKAKEFIDVVQYEGRRETLRQKANKSWA